MIEIISHKDVLSQEQIDSITESVKDAVIEADSYVEESHIEIEFGQFVNDFCLIYVDTSSLSDNIMKGNASFLINREGNFVSITNNGNKFDGLNIYDSENNLTLEKLKFRRLFTVEPYVFGSTDNYTDYYWKKMQPSDLIIYETEYSDGDTSCDYLFEEDEEENYEDEENERHYASGILRCEQYNKDYRIIYNGPVDTFTNIIIGRSDLLLKCQLPMTDDYYIPDYHEIFKYIFPEVLIDDLYKPRYGLFRLYANQILIHCGELKEVGGYFNGFRKIEFKNGKIYTYDKFDLEKGVGIPYSYHLTKPSNLILFNCATNESMYSCVNIIEEPYCIREGYRTGLNAGLLYIIREGEHAGRNISWLKFHNPNVLIKLISQCYLHISFMNEFTSSCIYGADLDNLWLANDLHYIYEDINMPEDQLVFSELTSRFYSGSIDKHCEDDLETIIDNDPNYLLALIKKHVLYIAEPFFEKMIVKRQDNDKLLKNLKLIEKAARESNEIIESYNNDLQNRYYEEEERQFYENEGYKDAYDGDPETQWNTD